MQNSVLNYHGTTRRNAFAIEGSCAKAANHRAVVDHGHVRAGNGFSELAGQKRRATIDRVSIHALENVFEHGRRNHGIEHHRNMRGLHSARAESPQCAPGGFFTHRFSRIEPRQAARNRIPEIALHSALLTFVLRDRHSGNRAVRSAIFADEPVGVGEDLPAGRRIERSSVRILDARVRVKRRFLRPACIVDTLGARQRVNILVIKIKVAGKRSQFCRLGNSSERVFRADLCQFERGLQHALDAGGGKVARISAGRTLSEEDADANGARARLFQGFDLTEPHGG